MAIQAKISRNEAIAKLWNLGNLQWKLDPIQKELYETFHNSKSKTTVWSCSRRLGKSYALCCIAVEKCLVKPNCKIKFIAPTQKHVKMIIRPLLQEILRDCPPELLPKFRTNDNFYKFKNGSEIQLAGTDSGHAETLRGGSADLCIIDEAGFCDDLKYIIQSILIPTTTTTRGKILLSSTPPKSPDHPFVKYMEDAEEKGNYVKKTIYDGLGHRITEEMIKEIIDELGGENSPEFRREYLCVSPSTLVRTDVGYKEIQNIEVGEKVLTHDGTYQKVLNHFINPLENRRMYKVITSNHLGFEVTEGHKFLVTTTNYKRDILHSKTNWIEVQDINPRPSERVYLKVPIPKSKNINYNIDRAYLAGWYVAEGHISKTQQQVTFSINKNDPIGEIQKAAFNIFKKEFQDYTSDHSKPLRIFTINSKEAKDFFKEFGVLSFNKRVPACIKDSNAEAKISFLKAYFLGDGSNNKINKTQCCVSNSKGLLADISDLLLSLGIGCQIRLAKKAGEYEILGRKVNQKNHYTLLISGLNYQKFHNLIEDSYCTHFVENGFYYSRILSIDEIKTDLKFVHDIEVENNHSYVGLHGTMHNCELIGDEEHSVVPEFNVPLQVEIIKEHPRPPLFDCYVAGDIGAKDFTVFLFGYYDFRNAKIIIEDEVVLKGGSRKVTTDLMASEINQKESFLWTNKQTGETQKPYKRVCDNDLIVINNLYEQNKLLFLPTDKYDSHAALNNMRMLLKNRQIIIHPRCKTLIQHLKYATWATNKKTYARDTNNGHYDAVDALKYFVRNVQLTKNPFPNNYGLGSGDNWWKGFGKEDNPTSLPDKAVSAIKSVFKVRPNIKFGRK